MWLLTGRLVLEDGAHDLVVDKRGVVGLDRLTKNRLSGSTGQVAGDINLEPKLS